MKKPTKLIKDKYEIHVNFSDEAIEKKIMKFITPGGEEFEITADEMATILVGQLNSETIEAIFVESERVNVVEVTRQIRVRLDKDFKAGEEIRLEYRHPYPVEFAIIEEAANLAKINMNTPRYELSAEYIDAVRQKITPQQRKFVDHIYKFFKNLKAVASPYFERVK